MNVQEFVNLYNAQPDEEKKTQVIREHIKKYYIPYVEKVTFCKNLVEKTCIKDDLFVPNTPLLSYIYVTKIIEEYTDLKFDEIGDFDSLEKNGITCAILESIGEDVNSFKQILDVSFSDAKEASNMMNYLAKTMNGLKDMFSDDNIKALLEEMKKYAGEN